MSQFLLAEVCLQPFYCNFIIDSSNEKPCMLVGAIASAFINCQHGGAADTMSLNSG